MAKLNVEMKIVGHVLVTERSEDGTEFDMLRVSARGTGDDKKTKVDVMVDVPRAEDFPLGEVGFFTFEIRQQRLPLSAKV